MKFTAKMIAGFLKGDIEGDADIEVSDVSKIEEGRPGTLAFLANPKYNNYLYSTDASIVLVNRSFKKEKPVKATLILVDNAYEAFATLLQMVASQMFPEKKGKEEPCFISKKAEIGKDCYIGAFAYIADGAKIGNNVKIYPNCYIGEGVEIKENTTLYAGVTIYHGCKIGANCAIHAGSVIGADGFGFAPQSEDNVYKKIPQIGIAIIEDNVELGAIVSVDRATMGATIIRKGVKLDNMVHIGHNVEVGENTVMAAQSGVAGSARVGRDCMFGGHVAIAPHITIANGIKLGGKTGANASLKTENTNYIGAPAIPYVDFMKQQVYLRKLADLFKKMDEMEKEIKTLKEKK
jgi:UDP-3-O-[3-hydroxymyristoyl] glucosamine N-acyltransferase